jgi:hypothetical protein
MENFSVKYLKLRVAELSEQYDHSVDRDHRDTLAMEIYWIEVDIELMEQKPVNPVIQGSTQHLLEI